MSNAKENECIEQRITFTSYCPSVVRALQIKFKSLSKDYLAIADPPTTHMCIKPMSPDSNTYSERHSSIVVNVVFHLITKFVSRFWKNQWRKSALFALNSGVAWCACFGCLAGEFDSKLYQTSQLWLTYVRLSELCASCPIKCRDGSVPNNMLQQHPIIPTLHA